MPSLSTYHTKYHTNISPSYYNVHIQQVRTDLIVVKSFMKRGFKHTFKNQLVNSLNTVLRKIRRSRPSMMKSGILQVYLASMTMRESSLIALKGTSKMQLQLLTRQVPASPQYEFCGLTVGTLKLHLLELVAGLFKLSWRRRVQTISLMIRVLKERRLGIVSAGMLLLNVTLT